MKTSVENDVRSGEIVIEIDEERIEDKVYQTPIIDEFGRAEVKESTKELRCGNDNVFFDPIQRAIRSRIEFIRFGVKFRLQPAVDGLVMLPGERIHIDIEKRVGRITDALFSTEYESVLDRAREAGLEMQPFPFFLAQGLGGEGTKPLTKEFHDDYAMWDWIFGMRRIVNQGCDTKGNRQCRPIQNVDFLPTLEDCIRSKKLRIRFNEDTGLVLQEKMAKKMESDTDYDPGMPTLTPAMYGLKPNRDMAGV